MARVYNFSAGPAVLPEEVLSSAAAEMLDYQGTGMSVMEMSHRSAAFKGIIETAEQDIRDLMNIPDNYRVLFLQGGATQQFAAIPMNLMQNKVADYIVSGNWSKKAFKEAKLYGDARCIASSVFRSRSYASSSRSSISPARYPLASCMEMRRARCIPSTMTRTIPFGIFVTVRTSAAIPIGYSPSACGRSCSGSCCVTRKIILA